MSGSEVIFSTYSSADFGLGEIVLTVEQAEHINIGHRDIANLPMTLLKQALEQTTQVHKSHHTGGRFVFVSSHVTNRSGRPMAVIVERVESVAELHHRGKVITATWKERVSGPLLWDSTNGLYVHLDAKSDILYISRGPAVVSYAVEDNEDPDIWYRYSDDDNSRTGITIFQVNGRKNREIAARAASLFLGVAESQLLDRLGSVGVTSAGLNELGFRRLKDGRAAP